MPDYRFFHTLAVHGDILKMPVPNSPHAYRRIIPVEIGPEQEDEFDMNSSKPPRPLYTAKYEQGRYTVGVETYLNHDLPKRKTSCPSFGSVSGGFHRSRDRTRQSAVQRLVERKLAQKEKEREKERDRSLGSKFDSFSSRQSFHSYSPTRQRDTSRSRSENGFILGAGRCSSPSKENIEPDFFSSWSRRSTRSVSGTRIRGSNEEPVAKTYITIGPGKPTRIREHSPAKSAKLTSDETVTSARERFAQSRSGSPLKQFDLNRQSSPSPNRKTSRNISPSKSRDILRDASPLKSTDILKTFRASKSESNFNSRIPDENHNTKPYFAEKVFKVNLEQTPRKNSRRLSVEILNNIHEQNTDSKNRASPETESSTSSLSSNLSGSTDSVESSDKSSSVLRQRRISLEQRFQARTGTARFTSPDRSTQSIHSFSQATAFSASTDVDDTWTHIKIRRYSTVKTHCEFSSVTGGPRESVVRPIPASRKISLPQTAEVRPEPAPRRRSLTTILSAERWDQLSCQVRILVMVILHAMVRGLTVLGCVQIKKTIPTPVLYFHHLAERIEMPN